MFEEIPAIPEMPFGLRQWRSGPHENFHYLLHQGKAGALVDPTFNVRSIMDVCQDEGIRVEAALITHGHWDHAGGAVEAVQAGADAIVGHSLLQEQFGDAPYRAVSDQDVLLLDQLQVQCLETPGHQPDAICYLVGARSRALFAGDTLFVGSCGRVDLAGGDPEAMVRSMKRLAGLPEPESILVCPGHDYADQPTAWLADEITTNPALSVASGAQLLALPFATG